MTREEVKKLYPVIQAFCEGKTIESRCIKGEKSLWYDDDDLSFDDDLEYRIKPESKYRPFKDAEECWVEMLKHEPFGWVKDKEDGQLMLITEMGRTGNITLLCNGGWDFDGIKDNFTFADGTPFGILEEE